MRHLHLTFLCIVCTLSLAAQTRGTLEGEIYYPTTTYQDANGQIHKAIFRSTDHDAHLQLQYETLLEPPAGDMPIGQVVGDATPGVLYNYGDNELWVSFDYGVSWEFREDYPDNTYYVSGNSEGLIYSTKDIKLNQSINYGSTFQIITDPLTIPIPEIGIEEGSFFGVNGDSGIEFFLVYTDDYANTYTETAIDSSIAFYSIGGYWPKITRGTIYGELYLISWWPDYHYKIFHSIDNGLSWTQQYESDAIDLYFWDVGFTAGRQSGSFYVFRNYLEHMGTVRELYIDYSSDYGQTFTTFHHVLDSTVSIAETPQKPQIKTYPNPFSDQLTIALPHNIPLTGDGSITIYNAQGQLVATKPVTGHTITWKPQNQPGGFYFIGVQSKNTTPDFHKVLFINH